MLNFACNTWAVFLLALTKEKSWSVKLANGFVVHDQVRSDFCKSCDSIPQLLLGNNGDKDLLLYGCAGHKCKHIMIRMKVSQYYPVLLIKNNTIFGTVSQIPQQ